MVGGLETIFRIGVWLKLPVYIYLRVRRFMVMAPFFFEQIRQKNIFSSIKNNFHLLSIAMFYA